MSSLVTTIVMAEKVDTVMVAETAEEEEEEMALVGETVVEAETTEQIPPYLCNFMVLDQAPFEPEMVI